MGGDQVSVRQTSLAEIAKEAKVSISTVSKVANDEPGVSEETRARVNAVIRSHRYVAKRRRQRTSRLTIVVLVRSMWAPNTLEVLRGVTTAGSEMQADIIVQLLGERRPDSGWIDEIRAAGRSGVIAVTSILEEKDRAHFRELGLPLVVIDPVNVPDEQTYSVGSTNWAGGLAATEHLLQLGHRSIAMLSGEDTLVARARVSGHFAALDAAGVRERLVLAGDFTFESGLELGERLLSKKQRPTAVFAASDAAAIGVIEAARRRGLRVPEDLSVVGFDDSILARTCSPPLTTVRQSVGQFGVHAVQMVVALVNGEDVHTHHMELATTLVIRRSTIRHP